MFKRFTRIQRILLIVIAAVTFMSCVLLGLRQNAMSNVGYSAWTYIKYGLIDYPLQSFTSMSRDVAGLWHVYTDNVSLNEQLAQQRSYQTLYEDERSKNQELEALIKMQGSLPDAPSIAARVMSRSAASWNQSFTISAGSSQGVEKSMLVVTSQGAVGLIEDVQTSTSTVSLLTCEDLPNDIAIKIAMDDGSSVEGVLSSYDAKKKAYCVSLFDNDAIVNNGQKVATSGKGGNYPGGIYVGTVMDMRVNDDAIVSTIYVKPVSNIGSFDYVLVLGSGTVS